MLCYCYPSLSLAVSPLSWPSLSLPLSNVIVIFGCHQPFELSSILLFPDKSIISVLYLHNFLYHSCYYLFHHTCCCCFPNVFRNANLLIHFLFSVLNYNIFYSNIAIFISIADYYCYLMLQFIDYFWKKSSEI